MSGACWQHQRIAGLDRHHQAVLAAEAHLGFTLADAQHLMRRAVVVRERKDAVSPGAMPAVGGEAFDACRGSIDASKVEHVLIDQQWQCRIVGNAAVVGEVVDRHLRLMRFRCSVIVHSTTSLINIALSKNGEDRTARDRYSLLGH